MVGRIHAHVHRGPGLGVAMRRFLFLTVSLAAVAVADPSAAQQSVFCTNCSTVAQQLAGYARQLLQLEQEMTMAKNSIANTLALPSTIYHDMTSEVTQIGSI